MAYLNQITHPSELIQKKVNFFADYFNYVAEQMGNSDELDIETYLSLTEKIIYQLRHNPKKESRIQNIDSYLSHPLIQPKNKYFKEFKSYRSLNYYFTRYVKIEKLSEKSSWIASTPRFLHVLESFRIELKRKQFKNALGSLISYLRCMHSIEEHKDDIFHYTNIIVSEFLHNYRTKADLGKIFERIITRDIEKFPFHKSLKTPRLENGMDHSKSEFMKTRSFTQQFEGIYNMFKEEQTKSYYLFRLFNVSAEKDFCFKYNSVTFYHPKNEKFKELDGALKGEKFLSDFFENDQTLIAVVKVNYHSPEIAKETAIKMVSNELIYFNLCCESNAYLNCESFITTSNFKTFRGKYSSSINGKFIWKLELSDLLDNPYTFLKKVNSNVKASFLKHEPIFINAINSNDISEYWRYLETIVKPHYEQVIDTVSTILLLNASQSRKTSLRTYIKNCIGVLSTFGVIVGMTRERQNYYYDLIRLKGDLGVFELLAEYPHPLLNHLSEKYLYQLTKDDLILNKKHYKRILTETYAQRNSLVHRGQVNERSLISLNAALPKLINRFRWLVLAEMKDTSIKSFEEVLSNLLKRGKSLI